MATNLEISIPKPWSVAVMELGSGAGSLVAGISHRDNYLGLWKVDPDRQISLLGRYLEVGFHPDAVRWLDWDGDGQPELLVAAEGRREIQLWRRTDSGLELAESVKAGTSPRDVAAADLDEDGFNDLVVGPYAGGGVPLLWGQGEFTFSGSLNLAARPVPSHPRVVDWNGDGLADIVWSEWDSGTVRVALNQGKREFETRLLAETGGSPRQLTVADINGDGAPDLVVALETGEAARILYNDGQGGIQGSEDIPAPVWGYSSVAVHGAGDDALVALGEEGRIILARGESQGKWSLKQVPAGSLPLDVQFADVDGDGAQDLAVANSAGQTIDLIFGPLWETAAEVSP